MPNSLITCAYKLTAVGARPVASLAAAMAAVPVDLTLPNLYGLLYSGDATATSGQTVTRTMQFMMVPSPAATGFTSVATGDSQGFSLTGLTVDSGGDGYAAPPLLTFAITSGNPPLRAARAHALMGASSANVLVGGSGYSGTPTVTFSQGQLAPGGVQATGHVGLTGSAVSSLIIDTPGGPYNAPPVVTISGGTGAIVSVALNVTGLILDDPGIGYATAPSMIFSPTYKQFFPDASHNQAGSLSEFMRARFQYFLQTSVLAALPVIT
jgi:hypothetical protein